MSLVQMTLSGGAFILFIVVVRALALHRLPKGAFLALCEWNSCVQPRLERPPARPCLWSGWWSRH